jgi:hypothetical protein
MAIIEKQMEGSGSPHVKGARILSTRSVLNGRKLGLLIDDGLGEYLVRLGLAKPFLLYSEWEEALRP